MNKTWPATGVSRASKILRGPNALWALDRATDAKQH